MDRVRGATKGNAGGSSSSGRSQGREPQNSSTCAPERATVKPRLSYLSSFPSSFPPSLPPFFVCVLTERVRSIWQAPLLYRLLSFFSFLKRNGGGGAGGKEEEVVFWRMLFPWFHSMSSSERKVGMWVLRTREGRMEMDTRGLNPVCWCMHF